MRKKKATFVLLTTDLMIILHSNNAHWIDILTTSLSNKGFRDIVHAKSGDASPVYQTLSEEALPGFLESHHRLIELLITDLPAPPAVFPQHLWNICAKKAIPFFAWLPEKDARSSQFVHEAAQILPAPFANHLETFSEPDMASASKFIDHIHSINPT